MAKQLRAEGCRTPTRTRKRSGWRLLGLGCLLLLAPLAARAASLAAALDTDTLHLGESATLKLTFEGGDPGAVPQLPALAGAQIAYGGKSSQMNWVNGQVSSSVTHSYAITPTQAGDLTIPALRVNVGGQWLLSQALVLHVLRPDAPPSDAQAQAQQLAFLRLVLPKQQVYVGETVVAQLQLYVREGVSGLSEFQLTAIPTAGFNAGKQVQGQQRQTRVGNAAFTVVPFSLPLTATRSGVQTLGPIAAAAVLQVPAERGNRDGFFDPFGMFNRTRNERRALATEAVQVQVLPLPTAGKPADFSGAVGNFTLSFSAGPTNVAVGDPITIRAQITGRGPIESLQLPDQSAWRDFKTYPPTTKVELADPLGLQGTKFFEEVVVPQNAELKSLPGFTFSYFDPDAKAYRTLVHPAVPLVVRPAGSTPPPSVANLPGTKPEEPAVRQDIVPLKQRLGQVTCVRPPLVTQPWFVAVQAVPVLAWLGLLGWRRRAESLANNPRLRRQRQVAQILREGLQELRTQAAQNRSDDFFATLFRLLQEQLGERLALPASAITEAVIEERLRPRKVSEPTLTGLRELFQRCNQARYAPVRDSAELAQLVPQWEQVSRELQALKL
jgi:hypothetical protein